MTAEVFVSVLAITEVSAAPFTLLVFQLGKGMVLHTLHNKLSKV